MTNDSASIITLFRSCAAAARTGDYGQASSILNTSLASLQKRLSGGSYSADDLNKLSYSLETLSLMQQQENWVAFADILEYELITLLQELGIS